MPGMLANDPILKRFRAALDELYGDRAEHVVRDCVDPTRWQLACEAARFLTPSQAEAVLCA